MHAFKRVAVAAVSLGVVVALGGPARADKPAASSGGKKTILILNVGPDPTDVYIDGKKRGTSDKVKEVAVEPGAHIVRLVHSGDEHEDQVILKKGQSVKFEWKFEDDRPKPAQPEDDAAGDAAKDAPPKDAAPKDDPK